MTEEAEADMTETEAKDEAIMVADVAAADTVCYVIISRKYSPHSLSGTLGF